MAMIALSLLLLPSVVSALRETHGLEGHQDNSFWGHCRSSKCNGGTYDLKDGGDLALQDCKVNSNKPFYTASNVLMCEETCKISSKPVKVARKSGKGPQSCSPWGLQEIAADFVEQLEKQALRLSPGDYNSLPMMKGRQIEPFLMAVRDEILSPEKAAAGGHGYSRVISKEAVQHVAIIGDLHGQLFNLIAYLLEIKEQYKDKGFSSLPGSSLLFCDPRMTYVFMGDYLDPGERGVELLMLLLAHKAGLAKTLHEGISQGIWEQDQDDPS